MSHGRRFSSTQLTTIICTVAVAVAIVGFPVGVWAVGGSVVTIADPTHPTRKAHVSATGRLLTTVDGTVGDRPLPPAKPWRYANTNVAGLSDVAVGPTTQTIDITSLSVSTQTDGLDFVMTALFVPGAATDCSTIRSTSLLYSATKIAIGAPLTASFPTPLQVRPPTGRKVCLWFQAPAAAVGISGYFGS